MAQLFANAARSTLTASITNSSTQLQINPADQALFPVATGADWFKVALEDSSGNLEYMRVQRAVGQSLLTITERATEDATKFPARSFVAGSLVELRMTAADMAASIAHPSVGTGAHAATAISVTPVGGISAETVQAALQELDTEKANAADVTTALDGKASTGANTFTGAQTLPGNADNPLEAVPKQQLDALSTGRLLNVRKFTIANSGQNFTPTAGMAFAIVEVQAPGGGSGGAPATASSYSGSAGGSSGAYAKCMLTSAQIGASQLMTIPAGGSAGAAGPNAGGNASAASFGALISCPGGKGSGSYGPTAVTVVAVDGAARAGAPTTTGTVLAVSSGNNGGQAVGTISGGVSLGVGAPSVLGEYGRGANGKGLPAGSAAVAGEQGGDAIIIVWEFS